MRHNSFENRYNQHVIAGKIALKINAMPEITEAVTKKMKTTCGTYNIYCWEDGSPDYATIGQNYLLKIGIEIKNLEDN